MTSRDGAASSRRTQQDKPRILGSLPEDGRPFTEAETDEFIRELRRAKEEVSATRKQFDAVTDPQLVDHVVFRLGAAEKRFNYLFQMARRFGITVNGVNWLWYDED